MIRLITFAKNFGTEELAATAVEYAIMVGFIATAIVGAVQAIGTALQAPFQDAADGLTP